MRFLLASQARSGTHMLRGAFIACDQIPIWWDHRLSIANTPGELPRQLARLYADRPGENSGAMTHFGEQPEQAIDHPDNGGWKSHWRQLRQMHDKVIVLTRRNHLRRYCSQQIASRDFKSSDYAAWASEQPRTRHPEQLTVSLHKYVGWHERTCDIQWNVNRILEPFLSVEYELLVNDWKGEARRIYEYLNLEWDSPTLSTHRQETRPIREVVSNWASLVFAVDSLSRNLRA